MRGGWDGERSVRGKEGVLAVQSMQSVHGLLALQARLAGVTWATARRRVGEVVVREARDALGAESAVGAGEHGTGRGSEAQPLSALLRAASLVGSASPSHCGGRGFESHSVHQAERTKHFLFR